MTLTFLEDEAARSHLLAVARCPVVDRALAGEATACSTIVAFQSGHSDQFQVPTPWLGRLDEAPILFVGANPNIGFNEKYPTRPADDDVKLIDAFHFAFESEQEWIKDGSKQLLADGGHSRAVAFWSHAKGRARELLGREPRPGIDYAITEIVRCRSWNETGVRDALSECAQRWFSTTLDVSPARVLIVFGKNAATAMRDAFDLGDKALAGPVVLGGRPRLAAFLPHPNARGRKTIQKVLGDPGLNRLRDFMY